MYNNFSNRIYKIDLIIILFTFFLPLFHENKAEEALFNWSPPLERHIKDYLKIHQTYRDQLCSHKEDEFYRRLYSEYQSENNYLPLLGEKDLDVESIKVAIKELTDKKRWIQTQWKDIEKSDLRPSPIFLKPLEAILKDLILKRHDYLLTHNKKLRAKYEKYSLTLMKQAFSIYQDLLKKIPYLLTYQFPVNFLELRGKYDQVKYPKKLDQEKEQNRLYMLRKILEDGTLISGRSPSDKNIRLLLNMVYLQLQKEETILSENLRYDLIVIIKKLQRILGLESKTHIKALQEWEKQTDEIISFYQKLLKQYELHQTTEITTLIESRNLARYRIKQFNVTKQKQVYRFWSRMPPLMQTLFVMETILFNEVGTLDIDGAYERQSIIQLIINRYHRSYFHQLLPHEWLHQVLGEGVKGLYKSNIWMNLLLKEGEFSFTYFFIPSSVKVYCPDMSEMAKKLRRENLVLILKGIKSPGTFSATHFFSRESMPGHIDMTLLWPHLRPLEERPGREVKEKWIKSRYSKKQFILYYFFKGINQQDYEVIDFSSDPLFPELYVVLKREGRVTFFQYRNPHHFKYFVEQIKEDSAKH